MTQLLRTCAILIASALVVGATWLLTPATSGSQSRRPPAREGQTAPDGAPRRERGGGRDNGGINIAGFGHVLRDTVLIGVVTVVFVSLERAWARRKGVKLGIE